MNKDAYLEKFKAKLDEWNAELEILEAKAKGASADAKIRYEEDASTFRKRLHAARERAKEMKAANENAWDDLRQGVEDAWKEVKDALERAKSEFK